MYDSGLSLLSIISAYSRYSSHQYASFLIMVAQDTLTLINTEITVEIRVTKSKAMIIDDTATKDMIEPTAINMPLEAYSLASIERGLLGVNTWCSLMHLLRISFAFWKFSLFLQFFFACSLNRTRIETFPIAVDPLMIPQRTHPSTVFGKKRPTSPCSEPMSSGGMNVTRDETITMIA